MSKEEDLRRRFAGQGNNKAFASVGFLLVVALIAVIIAFNGFFTVDAGERAVVLRFGEVHDLADAGLHFKIPFVDHVTKVDVRVNKAQTTTRSSSKDLQIVASEIVLNYNPEPDQVAEIYENVGLQWESRIVDPAVKETFKSITAQYTAEELITRRAEVSEAIRDELTTKLAVYGLTVRALSITDFDFSDEFNAAIESKQTAEQNALRAENDLRRIEIEAQQTIAAARAEAESLRIQKQEVTPDLLKLREIEVQSAAVAKWDGRLPSVTGGAVPFINVK